MRARARWLFSTWFGLASLLSLLRMLRTKFANLRQRLLEHDRSMDVEQVDEAKCAKCGTQLKAQGPSRTINKSKEEEEEECGQGRQEGQTNIKACSIFIKGARFCGKE